jgi:hypothetical protein
VLGNLIDDRGFPLGRQSIEQGVQRRGVEGQGTLRAHVDQSSDVVPVQRAVFNEGQNDEYRRLRLHIEDHLTAASR